MFCRKKYHMYIHNILCLWHMAYIGTLSMGHGTCLSFSPGWHASVLKNPFIIISTLPRSKDKEILWSVEEITKKWFTRGNDLYKFFKNDKNIRNRRRRVC